MIQIHYYPDRPKIEQKPERLKICPRAEFSSTAHILSFFSLFVVVADDFCYFVIVVLVDRCETRSARTARSSTPRAATAWTKISTTIMK